MVSDLKITLQNAFTDVGDVHTFIFDVDSSFFWQSGQHAVFSIEGIEETRVFSIASSPAEKIIRVATRIGENPSAFKANLRELRAGDTVNMRGPFGSFVVIGDTARIVGVAGGIGITPFLAILYDVYHGLSKAQIELVYSCKDFQYPFQKEITEFESSDSISIHYVADREGVCASLGMLVEKYNNNASFYLSGPPKMVNELKERLETDGINDIKNDPFLGY